MQEENLRVVDPARAGAAMGEVTVELGAITGSDEFRHEFFLIGMLACIAAIFALPFLIAHFW